MVFAIFLFGFALLGCNSGVPDATPDMGDDFLFQFRVVTPSPTVGEEITVVATVTNLTGYDYWIKIDEQICHFNTVDAVFVAPKFNRNVKFNNNETLTSIYKVSYETAGHYRISIDFGFLIGDTQFGFTYFTSLDVTEALASE